MIIREREVPIVNPVIPYVQLGVIKYRLYAISRQSYSGYRCGRIPNNAQSVFN
ncbi:hypothetical protein DPMN_053607 [Dreissena polymorpha]|uniref:Uncharacterized protein n=1 Tax=Dreissena polymorpha TaxID=45954 RepID=A0A9D4CMF3_DREPO|nr:hypothetical protein DPMN_053607 [Dreissena polymorpha]